MFAQAGIGRREKVSSVGHVRESVAAQPDRHAGRFSPLLVRGIAAADYQARRTYKTI
jgi:hypothetical protein